MANKQDPDRFEERQKALDPHRRETRETVEAQLEAKLAARGVTLNGDETSNEIADILDAVERFERAVQVRGGDLMVDEKPGGRPKLPNDRHFTVPERRADEPVEAYLERLRKATRVVLSHPDRAD